tara:strand:+ start:7452 stop:8108 length:657 start_codon:yes stop_codon:yes gene_type:complete
MAKIIFYSAQTGNRGFIPSIKEQKLKQFNYYFFHDSHPQAEEDKGWSYRNMYHQFRNLPDPKRQRLFKMCPNLIFHEEYDYTVWVDCKFYQHRKFYELCEKIIKDEKPNFMVCPHELDRSFDEEMFFAEHMKQIPVDDLDKVKEHKIGKFYSTDTCWLIRKNTHQNNLLGMKWFNMTNVCFTNECRDQLTISSCINKDYLEMNHTIAELMEHSFTRHV